MLARAAHLASRGCVFPPSFATLRHLARGNMASAAWDGSGTQEDLMNRDECILVVRHVFFFSRRQVFVFRARSVIHRRRYGNDPAERHPSRPCLH